MTLWEELGEIKKQIPKDFRPWSVVNKYKSYTGEHWIDIEQTNYVSSDLGLMDEPMSIYRGYGIYSSKENAIAAAREFKPTYKIYCEGKLV